jgi:hypothetical protein
MSPNGTSRTSRDVRRESVKWAKADIEQVAVTNRDFMSTRPSSGIGAQAQAIFDRLIEELLDIVPEWPGLELFLCQSVVR